MKKYITFFLLFLNFSLQSEDTQAKKKTICLNMIVKNESQVITRCLGSVKPIIDYWVIYDTGSTDGTQQIIKDFMKDIPGELHESPWVNFAHNRNEVLNSSKGKGDYLLFIDADEAWIYSDDFTLPELNKDSYYIVVRQLNAAETKRIALVDNHLDWKWEGVLHEDVRSPQARTIDTLKGVKNICNAVQGARAKDPEKFLKDAKVFEESLKDDPQNSRYMFYLAQSYLAAEKYDLAKQAYLKRVIMQSGDVQETYLTLYSIGLCDEKMGNLSEALKAFNAAYAFRPTRAEPLLQMAKIYRKEGNYLLGFLLTNYALTLPYPAEDLCVEYTTYDHGILIEYSNCTLLMGKNQEGLEACTKLLANPNLPQEYRDRVQANYNLAKKRLYGEAAVVP